MPKAKKKPEETEDQIKIESVEQTAPVKERIKPILTIESGGEIESQKDKEDTAWHDIQNAYLTHKILSGDLSGLEKTESYGVIAVVYYNNFRIAIPIDEMFVNPDNIIENARRDNLLTRKSKVIGSMIGAEIDFIIKGLEPISRSIVASRREAMLKKRQMFYIEPDKNGEYWIYENMIIQARVIAVAEKVIRIETFGVEDTILLNDLSSVWLVDAYEEFSVGDKILVRINSIKRDDIDSISIKTDVKSVTGDMNAENMKKCQLRGKYCGKVVNVDNGRIYLRLNIGVNAVAHSYYGNRLPAKKDDVSFVVTMIDDENMRAKGIITKVLRQNI